MVAGRARRFNTGRRDRATRPAPHRVARHLPADVRNVAHQHCGVKHAGQQGRGYTGVHILWRGCTSPLCTDRCMHLTPNIKRQIIIVNPQT